MIIAHLAEGSRRFCNDVELVAKGTAIKEEPCFGPIGRVTNIGYSGRSSVHRKSYVGERLAFLQPETIIDRMLDAGLDLLDNGAKEHQITATPPVSPKTELVQQSDRSAVGRT